MTSDVHVHNEARPKRRFRLAAIFASIAVLSGAVIFPASGATITSQPAGATAFVADADADADGVMDGGGGGFSYI